MRWIELSLDVPREDEEAFATLLNPIATGGVVIEEGYIAALWEPNDSQPSLLVTVTASILLRAQAPSNGPESRSGLSRR